jgi:hypothetical protein
MIRRADDSPEAPQNELGRLSNEELVFHTTLLARGERRLTIRLLHHLNELQRRQLFLELGYPSLFEYCVRGLRYSPSAAGRRIQAARAIRRHPAVEVLLQSGELNLATTALVEPVLSEDNRDTLLSRVRKRSYREVQAIVAEYKPPVPFRTRIRPLHVQTPGTQNINEVIFDREAAHISPHYIPRTTCEMKMVVEFLADPAFIEQFERVKALLSHRYPTADFAEIITVLMAEFLERHSPEARHARREEKKGQGDESRASDAPALNETPVYSRRREWESTLSPATAPGVTSPEGRTRHIPDAVRDAVFVRDGGRCTFVGTTGVRCGSRWAVQVDHVHPWAMGGTHNPANLRLLCGAHNRHAAEIVFG